MIMIGTKYDRAAGRRHQGKFEGRNSRAIREEIMLKNVLLLTLAVLLLGCATSGREFDTNVVNKIEIGKTTEGEVISMLGMPMSQKKLDNGIVVYSYVHGDRALFGADSSVQRLQVQFYNGVVIDRAQKLSSY
jgi:hypothetical protein